MTQVIDIPRNTHERMRVEICEYKGCTYIDLRVWYQVDGGEFKRSSKGVMLRPTQIPEIIQGLTLAAEMVDPQHAR